VSESNGLQTLGVVFLVIFLFLAYSRITDILLPNLRLALLTSTLGLAVTLFTGGLRLALLSRVGIWLSMFTSWLVLAVPFSYWQGGSVRLLQVNWLKSFLSFVIAAGLLRSTRDCRAAMYSIAGGSVVIVLMCLLTGGTQPQGRLTLDHGILRNPNDLAQLLLMGLPFLMLMTVTQSRNPLTRPVSAVCVVAVLLVIGWTGSRGAMLAVGSLIIVMVFSLSWKGKLKLVGALAVAATLVIPFISPEQRLRYLSTFAQRAEDESDQRALSTTAIGSTMQRLQLLRESVWITLHHPLVGVGPGMFQVAAAQRSEEQGQRGVWRETHNTFTQVSAEAGLPALICYLAALIWCLRRTYSISNMGRAQETLGDVSTMAYYLWLALIAFAVTACFSSVAYLAYFPTLAGLSVALSRCVDTQLASTQPARAHIARVQPVRSRRARPQRPVRA
jgi:O-antigen ligase